MEKSNIQHLRDILSEFSDGPIGEDPKQELITEMGEFIDAIEDELNEAKDKIATLQEKVVDLGSQIDSLEDEDGKSDLENVEYLGVDTLSWGLEKGNLLVQERMETFVEGLKKDFGMIPS